MESLQGWGIQLIQGFQLLSPALDSVMEFFTFLGKIEFYMLFITFLYWIVDARLGFRVFMVLLSTDIIGMAFKHLFRQPRPYWIGDVDHMGQIETSYGIPSTHASDSLSVWASLAYQVKKRWMWIVAIATILLISFSRMYLGVHFPHDILGGWIIGLAVLFSYIKYEQRVSEWLGSRSNEYQIGLGFGISLAFIVVGLIISAVIAPTSDSSAWSHMSTEARSLTSYFTLGGALFGAVAGYVMMKFRARFQTRGPWINKVLRYLVGILGVLIAMYGLDALFSLIAPDETVLGYILRYIRYGTTTFWAMFGAPWVFLKLNLTKKYELA
jgi:membrane-associated phospholipid phosphatase